MLSLPAAPPGKRWRESRGRGPHPLSALADPNTHPPTPGTQPALPPSPGPAALSGPCRPLQGLLQRVCLVLLGVESGARSHHEFDRKGNGLREQVRLSQGPAALTQGLNSNLPGPALFPELWKMPLSSRHGWVVPASPTPATGQLPSPLREGCWSLLKTPRVTCMPPRPVPPGDTLGRGHKETSVQAAQPRPGMAVLAQEGREGSPGQAALPSAQSPV